MDPSTGMTIWTFSALYWTLGAILALLGGLVVAGALALIIQIRRHRRREAIAEWCSRRVDELLGRVEDEGIESVSRGDAPRRKSRRRLLGRALRERMSTGPRPQAQKAGRLYGRLGYVRSDRRQAGSRHWQKRLEAMRRLSLVGGFRDRELLLKGLGDHPRIRLICAHILTRRGDADDAIRALNSLELSSSLMEQPVYAMLRGVDDGCLSELLGSMERIRDSRVRRALIVRAAERGIAGLEDILESLRASDDAAIRVGVCLAAGQCRDEFGAALLEDLLGDPSWEVRAYAAKSLAGQDGEARLNSLAWALNDPSFWSRDESVQSSEPAAIEGESKPTADELCHFDDYLDNAVRWIPHFVGDDRAIARRTSASVGRKSA